MGETLGMNTPLSGLEIPHELTDPSKIVVIHPGSFYLRLGLASDPQPKEVLHCIARKRKYGHHRDPILVSQSSSSYDHREARLSVASVLASTLTSQGRQRFQSKHYPGKAQIIVDSEVKKSKDIHPESQPETVVGNDILKLASLDPYNLHFPYQRGDLRARSGVIGGSLSSLLVDLNTIWTSALSSELNISPDLFPSYKVVLIIPSLYSRPILKSLLRILLLEIGFGSAFLLQDHVAATFGSGVPVACVVDAGDQKISVSCVEDGISHPDTRIQLNYGGGDISRIYYTLLKDLAFPYSRCNPENSISDAFLIHNLKKEHCHLNLDICGCVERTFSTHRKGEKSISYTIYVGDEAIIAPSALFHTELLEITGNGNRIELFTPDEGDHEDPHDLLYLNETSRKYTKAGDPSGDMDVSQNLDDDLDIVLENNQTKTSTAVTSENVLSLDQAILKSIEACPSDDLKKKMYSCILLVGGGLKFDGITQFLKNKLILQISSSFRSEPMDIIIDAKDTNAEFTTWRGAAVLACLESAQELWIKPREFAKHGQKILRERAPFPWT
ncbi:actin-related protein 8 [Lepeophtheirus salmonis]|uniref:Actin-related protein 8 n=1 Tax=Lepeophtheirus salmonis TaxID=72036 RepID=A0A0K2UE24_LEPSM|nr:actin-related protein 8-like [Lepeophtheirus salmonis]